MNPQCSKFFLSVCHLVEVNSIFPTLQSETRDLLRPVPAYSILWLTFHLPFQAAIWAEPFFTFWVVFWAVWGVVHQALCVIVFHVLHFCSSHGRRRVLDARGRTCRRGQRSGRACKLIDHWWIFKLINKWQTESKNFECCGFVYFICQGL